MSSGDGWKLPGTTRDSQSITRDWQLVGQKLIDGVQVREVANVMTGYGRLTEIYRSEWDEGPVGQVFQSVLASGGVSAWHAHAETVDRLFITAGKVLVVLYDARPASPTNGALNIFRFGEHRPGLVWVPPQVWHGIKNVGDGPSTLLNVVDRAYSYEQPDHYRVSVDSGVVPYDIVSAL
jgi:dTDP-4-dehydrorhamnose 3,5-epimerase